MPETSIKITAKNLTKKAFSSIQQSLDKTTKHFQDLAKESSQANQGLIGSLNRLKGSLEANREGFQSVAIGAGAIAATTGLLTKSFVTAAMQMEKMKMGLIAVMGSSEAAEKQLAKLKEVAKLPGLGLQEAVQGATRLQVAGASAEEAAIQLTAFGSAVARAGGGRVELARVVEQIAQMSAKSEVLMEDFRPIVSLMPDVVKAMDSAFGTKQIEQIRDMGISSAEFIAGIITELGKLPSIGGTAANSIENLQDSIFELKASLGEALLPMVQRVINSISKIVNWFNQLSDTQKSIIAWGTAITAGLTTITAGIVALGIALPGIITGITTLATIAIPALGSALAFLAANPIVLATAAIAGLGLALGKLIDKLVVARMVANIEKETVRIAKTTEEYIKKVEDLKNEYSKLDKELQNIKSSSAELSSTQKNRIKEIEAEQKAIEKRLQYASKAGIIGATLPTRTIALPVAGEGIDKRQFALRQQEIQLIEDKHEKEYQLALLARDRNVANLKKELDNETKTAAEKSIIRQQIFTEDELLRKKFTEINARALESEIEQERKAREAIDKIRTEFSDKYATYNYEQQYSNLKITQELSNKYLSYNYEKQQEDTERRKQLLQDIFEHNKKLREQALKDEEKETQRRLQLLQRILEHNRKIHAEQAKNLEDLQERTPGFIKLSSDVMSGQRTLGKKPSDMSERIGSQLAQQISVVPTDLIDIYQERKQIESDAQDELIQLEKEKQVRIDEIRQQGNLSHIERLRQLNQIEKQYAEQRKQIEIDTTKSKSAVFSDYVKNTVAGIGQIIAAELRRQAIMTGLTFAGTAIGGPLGGILVSAAGSMVAGGGFDNPKHDAIARSAGFMYGASFDNPNNDYRAQLRGTMKASQDLGERSASDMVDYFAKGFEQSAGNGNNEQPNQLQGVLGKIEQRLGETP
ncbi:tape measure protein, partial [bacterium]|nr:tape measure protein [bacterium]